MAAHTLKGGCWYVGAKRLAELCELLEESAEAGDLTDVDAGVVGIENELVAVRAAIERALGTGS